ncbi:MAG: carboxypeptidase regulatory-like domain-containing protein [Symploca sp. SIO3C6]|uniref:Carboxypeptidase regulatory-like domain-containing protein n=1 Tax=Symploca sp. SIO1C4 TaxID=2607765 RepID=A0A6B3NBQ1_9CYAN|nr:carboxypeptidase regulatory-like domain-containing protein [Symploca sp. SIO3C6]NER27474.1 carboxypeptidase regulatory-like domain-containing protein [Symploca sp. SIO1C4]NET06819.1 carboxypeptidase regulatory-like domain-containing protein [Symploca sp. SIO2B6]
MPLFQWKIITPLILVSIFNWPIRATAHGVKIEAKNTQAIEIYAQYDNGEPMSNTQVTVYAPQNPATPWLQGTSDESGKFVFVPDSLQPGNWAVQVRKAGHGNIINITLGEEAVEVNSREVNNNFATSNNSNSSYTAPQKVLMGAAIIWGFVGTALFFSRGKSNAHS